MCDLDFKQVGELAEGIGKDAPPAVEALVGSFVELHYQGGAVMRYSFSEPDQLFWEALEGDLKGTSGTEACFAFNPRDRLFLVDYLDSSEGATSVSLVFDLDTGNATVVVGTLPSEADVQKGLYALANEGSELTGVRAQFRRAAIDRPFDEASHTHLPTSEMVGKRVQYIYSPSEAYEHIYLNEKLYAWQCLAGVEKGLADVDRCHAFKLGEQLYLFVWREKIVPTLGVLVADWEQHRSFGKLFGYESSDFGRLVNKPIASHSTLLNVTTHRGSIPPQGPRT